MKDKNLHNCNVLEKISPKEKLPFSMNTQCIRTAQRHSLVLACYFSWLTLRRLQCTSTVLPWLTGATKSASIKGALKIMGFPTVVNSSAGPLYFNPSTYNHVLSCSPRHSHIYSSHGNWAVELPFPGPSSALVSPLSQGCGDRRWQQPLTSPSAWPRPNQSCPSAFTFQAAQT